MTTKNTWIIPIRIRSPNQTLNVHWAKRHKENKKNDTIIRLACKGIEKTRLPCRITLTRISPGTLDYDNLVASLKAPLDVLADMLIPGLAPGRADGDSRLAFYYMQEKGKDFALKVEVESV